MMAKIGRNDPCPCGSGQKYKRCCLPRDEATAAERAAAARAAALVREADERAAADAAIHAEDDGLDDASNVVIDLLDAGRLDEAEQAAHDLLERYPQVHDGLERLAMVAAARGDRVRAAEYYRKAADFVLAHGDPHDLAMHTYLRKRAAALDPAIR
jgi:tetratricopeptide (TPR) repeat protein